MRTPSLPTIDLPGVDADKLTAAARDAAYITVGFGVLAVQKLQVRRLELKKQIETSAAPLASLVTTLAGQAGQLDERLETVATKVDVIVEKFAERLPSPADDVVAKVHGSAKAVRKQALGLLAKAA